MCRAQALECLRAEWRAAAVLAGWYSVRVWHWDLMEPMVVAWGALLERVVNLVRAIGGFEVLEVLQLARSKLGLGCPAPLEVLCPLLLQHPVRPWTEGPENRVNCPEALRRPCEDVAVCVDVPRLQLAGFPDGWPL